ncbi:MAG TPA: tRNA pseudouridine(38-40) synthase TruA [Actinomycetota bacterium]|nr:tRNA pseudouridine(38-40) synthase TruA [Actinomycetota bacterium]
MARTIRLTLAYDGTDFRGFARQRGLRTVQGELEGALARILGTVPGLSVAGRTDAGVHARGQVVSFGVPPALLGRVDPARLQRALNGLLAPEVVVVRAAWAPPGFDARRSARAREYRYRIDVGPLPDPFTARYVWHRPGDPSLPRMRAAARFLVGEHDFASFCRRPEAGGTVRRLERLAVSRRRDRVEVLARANAFCHQMVRSLVGTLLSVGEGRLAPEEMPAILAARDRRRAGPVAPPHGLTLERVIYGPLTAARSRR